MIELEALDPAGDDDGWVTVRVTEKSGLTVLTVVDDE
jgi:hypothetical protein